jgi:multiple sugar transport system substrate-binding protein
MPAIATLVARVTRGLAIAAAAACTLAAALPATAAEVPTKIVINQSPWLAGFSSLVELYEKETGNKVSLDVNPYAGSLEKQRNAVRATRSDYDILIINGIFYSEMYRNEFLEPLNKIDPAFKLDPQLYPFDDTAWYDAKTKTVNRASGELMTVPVNPNISLLFYRKDLYDAKNLKVPTTWAELLANAKALNDPPRMQGIVQRAARGNVAITWDFWPYLLSHGGSMFRNEKGGDFFVTLNSPAAKEALTFYVELARAAGPKNTASLDQTDLIQYLATGRAAQAILVVAAQSQMEDPNKSLVTGKIGYATLPHKDGFASAPALGHWLGGIPKNIPQANKAAALAFLKWFQLPATQLKYAELGGAPVSKAAFESAFADRPENRYMKAMVQALPTARQMWTIPEGAEIAPILDVGLNRAVAGEISPAAALNAMSKDIEQVVKKAGYATGRLPDLQD